MKYREFRLSLCHSTNHVSIFWNFAYINRGVFPIAEGSTTNLFAFSYMNNKYNNRERFEKQYGPRIVGVILHDYLENSDEPLAVAYREQIAETEEEDAEGDQLFRDLWPNTELSVDLKLLTRKPGRLKVGEHRKGELIQDGEFHLTFIESVLGKMGTVAKRNPIVYRGLYANIHSREDGSLYPVLTRPHFDKDLTFQDFCRKAAKELIFFACLIKEG